MLGLDPRSRRFESYHSDKITGCNSDGFRELASDARGRWFESSHPDKITVCRLGGQSHVSGTWSRRFESCHADKIFGIGRSYELVEQQIGNLKYLRPAVFAWLAQLGFRAGV